MKQSAMPALLSSLGWLSVMALGSAGCGSRLVSPTSGEAGLGDAQAEGGVDCSELVITPGGPRARACVHEVPNGATVTNTMDGGMVVLVGGVVVATYPPCPCPVQAVGPPDPTDAGPPTTTGAGCEIVASDYDQSCQVDRDCVLVFVGNVCASGTCRCENAAIRASAQPRYQSDVDARSAEGGLCFCPCIGTPTCDRGVCGVKRCGE